MFVNTLNTCNFIKNNKMSSKNLNHYVEEISKYISILEDDDFYIVNNITSKYLEKFKKLNECLTGQSNQNSDSNSYSNSYYSSYKTEISDISKVSNEIDKEFEILKKSMEEEMNRIIAEKNVLVMKEIKKEAKITKILSDIESVRNKVENFITAVNQEMGNMSNNDERTIKKATLRQYIINEGLEKIKVILNKFKELTTNFIENDNEVSRNDKDELNLNLNKLIENLNNNNTQNLLNFNIQHKNVQFSKLNYTLMRLSHLSVKYISFTDILSPNADQMKSLLVKILMDSCETGLKMPFIPQITLKEDVEDWKYEKVLTNLKETLFVNN